jgi:beta-glucosidase
VDVTIAMAALDVLGVVVLDREAGMRDGSDLRVPPGQRLERPVRWLAGFAKAEAHPGCEVLADVAVPLRCRAHWDTAARTWAIEPGDFHLHIGRSSRDVPLPVTVTASSGTDMPGGTPGGSRC